MCFACVIVHVCKCVCLPVMPFRVNALYWMTEMLVLDLQCLAELFLLGYPCRHKPGVFTDTDCPFYDAGRKDLGGNLWRGGKKAMYSSPQPSSRID